MSSNLQITADQNTVPMGRSVCITAQLDVHGEAASSYLLLPFVNDRRWGAHERPDDAGQAVFLLPLPNPGPARIQVIALPANDDPKRHAAGWMGLQPPDLLLAGKRMPAGGGAELCRSNILEIEVAWRNFPRPANSPSTEPETLFGMQWEPWFSGGAPRWGTSPAAPVTGFYDSYNREVTRQHILWFMDLGVDFILPDWTNHLWDKQHWDERHEGVNAIVHATTLFLEILAEMREEGLPVPKVALFPGLSNGRPATMQALNEELAWIYHTYVRNPRFKGLWQEFDGKPLMVVLDTGAVGDRRGRAEDAFRVPFFKHTLEMSAAELDAFRAAQPPVDDSQFTIRWMSSQNETTRHHELGYWSWMDGTLQPPVAYHNGRAEAATASVACFHALGWTAPTAYGRRGGATYLETFRVALQHRPRVVFLHQFNEFSGQRDGQGMGPNRDIYADSYSVELSDDIEPVSLRAPGYRGDGGWGYYYLNLTQALMAVYRGDTDSTLLAVSSPLAGAKVAGEMLQVAWTTLKNAPGAPQRFTVLVDGQAVLTGVEAHEAQVSLAGLQPGAHTLTIIAEGATTRYPLSSTELDIPNAALPVSVNVPIMVQKA